MQDTNKSSEVVQTSFEKSIERFKVLVVVLVLVCMLSTLTACFERAGNTSGGSSSSSASFAEDSAATIAQLFEEQKSKVVVEGTGTVIRLLDDDTKGDQHQKFILELASGQTILIAHNIDIAPRLDGLEKGDTVEFRGEYIYTEEGGTVHWTHRDPSGRHRAGWLIWNGQTYQ